jgi:hypothetical protein
MIKHNGITKLVNIIKEKQRLKKFIKLSNDPHYYWVIIINTIRNIC